MRQSTLYIKKDGRYRKVLVQNILYLNAEGSYLHLVTTTEDFSLPQNLSQFVQKNEVPYLVRVHRSYLVNIQQIHSFDHTFAYVGPYQIPIGSFYRNKLLKCLMLL